MFKRVLTFGIVCFIVSFFGTIRAEDTEIFGGGAINIPPNVLIIFDTSGSMDEYVTVQGSSAPYDPNIAYSGSYSRRWLYRTDDNNWWYQDISIGTNEVVDSDEISCQEVRDILNTQGHWLGTINTRNTYSCTGNRIRDRHWRTGNYRNYLQGNGAQSRKKINVAKDTIKNLIDTTTGVRFGLMVFNNNEGGHLVAPCADRNSQAQKDALKSIIDGFSANGWTPLAETMAEAGLYFARQPSWFDTNVNYATPSTFGGTEHAMLWRCQKNYIIVMTDGESTQDRNSILTAANYMYNKSIGDYDQDVGTLAEGKHTSEYYWMDSANHQTEYASSGSDYLDDVAKFLNVNDLLPATVHDSSGVSFDNSDFPVQDIKTYTIGFAIDHKLLSDTGINGQGNYYTTGSTVSLSDIFERIISNILAVNAQFVSPVVPVNRINRTYADNGLYLGIFAPDSNYNGLWKGNIKKFGFSKDGAILDRNGDSATNSTGTIMDVAKSAWVNVTGNEGMQVDKGGAGEALKGQTTRYFKTFKPGAGAGTGDITFGSSTILPSDLGLCSTTDDTLADNIDRRNDLMAFVTASGIYAPNGTKPRSWILGDIIHSQPAILYDRPNNRNVLFVGANDGFLHCFVDWDKGIPSGATQNDLSDDEVSEAWAFVPWDLLPNLQYLPSSSDPSTNLITGDTIHDYFVDGSPEVYKIDNSKYLAFGLRRGGRNISTGTELQNQYFILNVTDYNTPSYVAAIAKTILGTEMLGQSWSQPHFCTIKTGSGENEKTKVLLLTGGYDTNQDNDDPGVSDSKGRAFFAINASNGSLVTSLNFNNSNYTKMKYSMVDFKSYDDNDDGCDDIIYAPSLGGDLFVFDDAKNGTIKNGVWSNRLLFQAAKQDGSTSKLRKFFYSPGIAQEIWGDYVYIGSGDRENPPNTTVTNRFYAIKNTWPETWNDNSPITDTNLTDVTADVLQGTVPSPSVMTEEEKSTYRSDLNLSTNLGWYIDLEGSGEKVVSTPLVYNKVVYFTTFVPTTSVLTGTDKCSAGTGSGEGRLYAVDYLTGEAVFNYFDGINEKLTKEDRYVNLGSGIPSQPSLVVTERGTFIVVGTEKGTSSYNTNDKSTINRFFWQKQ